MKRCICVVLTVFLLMALCSCSAPKQKLSRPVNFYYCTKNITFHSNEGVIQSEQRESQGYENDLSSLVELYLSGPLSGELSSPFPEALQVIGIRNNKNWVYIELSENFGTLTGIKLTTACACITLTLWELTGASNIQIRAHNALLNGRQVITMNAAALQLTDAVTAAPPQ